MKLLFDVFPIILFFIAYKLYNIYIATGVAILASILQVIYIWLIHRRVEKMQLLTLVIIVVFGGATLFLHNPIFIKWKPSVLNWLLAIAFLASQIFAKKPFIQQLMEKNINMAKNIWLRLNMAWVLFFGLMGFLNLYVIYNFSTDAWVNFKLFGMLGLTLLFAVAQGVYLLRHIKPEGE